ncbi:hypothetical protein TcCL_NonESM12014 [Trypanosoma cruzi]|uniref:Trans-sialidase n=1 Tax=Trypanosoma cruzi (strain CL Brener) TaxID=353153 RepID=Q4DN18_TRYCC|nr:hypothetical protein Tc00.1047053506993.140 [Trypanosoma cruzi]EAN93921.1 hypothetical protein Tc00.1047053506993.140 [Trypanosoma cruzi]RNC38713.1 hypothetical protein TcCL_NonESM12014 [Trypanosoma cruzi]|eukprot:XP_815772.1 hypothetical protein [Trypanosoma cruzi strain CL Brener]
MHGRNGELGAVCHVANAVHTCSNCAVSCARKEEGATVAFTMNVTTHKYAGPYELWWRQFSPDGAIHPPARSSDADRTGICQLPAPREGKDDTKSGGTTAPQVNAEPSRQNEVWRRSAAADGPNTVDPSPASNTATNTSGTKPEFASNPNEMMVQNASKKRPSFANGPRILVASNASGIMSVTCGGREDVAADNTDEVSERGANGRKSLVLENGVAGSGFVAEGDAGGMTQRNASGHDNRPQLREFTAQYSGSGGSPHDCFAPLNFAKLTLRELTVDGTVRVCVCWVLLLLLGLCGVVAVL